jgi:stage V sporulation protein SpoVS
MDNNEVQLPEPILALFRAVEDNVIYAHRVTPTGITLVMNPDVIEVLIPMELRTQFKEFREIKRPGAGGILRNASILLITYNDNNLINEELMPTFNRTLEEFKIPITHPSHVERLSNTEEKPD